MLLLLLLLLWVLLVMRGLISPVEGGVGAPGVLLLNFDASGLCDATCNWTGSFELVLVLIVVLLLLLLLLLLFTEVVRL